MPFIIFRPTVSFPLALASFFIQFGSFSVSVFQLFTFFGFYSFSVLFFRSVSFLVNISFLFLIFRFSFRFAWFSVAILVSVFSCFSVTLCFPFCLVFRYYFSFNFSHRFEFRFGLNFQNRVVLVFHFYEFSCVLFFYGIERPAILTVMEILAITFVL